MRCSCGAFARDAEARQRLRALAPGAGFGLGHFVGIAAPGDALLVEGWVANRC